MKPIRILIVDDDKDFAESLGDLVESEGHQPILAYNGMEALKIFKQNNVDIIIVDFKMPGLNGIETLFEIRKLNSTVPVVMMTAHANKEIINDAKLQGVVDTLDKPFNINKLMKIIAGVSNLQHILLLDDDKDFADSLSTILFDEGYNVQVAYNAEQAEHFIINDNIQLLLLDLRINGGTGIDVWNYAKENHHDVPTIFITGHSDDFMNQIEEIMQTSKIELLSKPFGPDELLTKIRKLKLD